MAVEQGRSSYEENTSKRGNDTHLVLTEALCVCINLQAP
jgi:hypothetical protein